MYCDDGSRADVDFIDDGLKMAVTWLPKGRTEILHAQRTGEEFRGDQSRAVVAGGSIAFTQRGKIRVCHRTPEESYDMQALLYTLAPVLAVVLGAIIASRTKLNPGLVAGLQHLAAGVVFAAAATEILPQVKHEASPSATLIGGAAGVVTMLGLKAFEARFKGPMALLAAIGIDILVDGLVLGLAFVAGEKAGFLLTIALTLEVLFLGLTLTNELAETYRSRLRIIVIVSALALLLPIGALAAVPVATLSPVMVAGFLSFGLMALLYLVTEELLVEAHEKPDTPLISSMFFVGFLALLTLEEIMG